MLRLNFSPFRFDACSCTLLNTKWRESQLNKFAHHAFQLLGVGVRLDVRAEVLFGRFLPNPTTNHRNHPTSPPPHQRGPLKK